MTQSHDLLSGLGEIAREETALSAADERWEALARGELSTTEIEALRAHAQSTEAGRELWELYTPFDDSLDQSVLEAIRPQQGADTQKEPPAKSNVLSFRQRAAVAGVILALAAGFTLMVNSRPDTLPRYALAVAGGDHTERGASTTVTATPIPLSPETELDITLVPERRLQKAVYASAWLVSADRWVAISHGLETAPSGAVRLRGQREALFGAAPAGSYRVVVFVSPEPNTPADAHAAALAEHSSQLRSASIDVAILP